MISLLILMRTGTMFLYGSKTKTVLATGLMDGISTQMIIDLLVKGCPLIAAALYATVGLGYFIRKDYAWSLVWISYSLANVGLVLAATERTQL